MSRLVRVLPKAQSDLRGIAETIRGRVSSKSARRWMDLLQAAITDLADSAAIHPEADEAVLLGRDVRMRIAGKRPHLYRILFTYTTDVVNIHRVRHAAQNYLNEDEL